MGALNNSLEKSVGDPKKGAANRPSDVETVQGLLNIQSIQGKRNDRLLPISGYVDDDTQRAILDFQELSGQARSGLIAPDDATFRALSAYRAPNGFGISHRGIDRLKRLEGGYHRYLYDSDGAGNTTIGFGHLVHYGKIDNRTSEEPFRRGITEMRAEQILRDGWAVIPAKLCYAAISATPSVYQAGRWSRRKNEIVVGISATRGGRHH